MLTHLSLRTNRNINKEFDITSLIVYYSIMTKCTVLQRGKRVRRIRNVGSPRLPTKIEMELRKKYLATSQYIMTFREFKLRHKNRHI